jgi:hypothetical protein
MVIIMTLGASLVHKTHDGWLSGFTPCGLDKMENRSLDVTTDGKKVTCPLCLTAVERTDK